ncbi:MAG: hypothetical protein QM770_11920 [Tepidisphaeraceae bacterium]
MADVYLAEFPASDRSGLMHAAAMARPVVTMASRDATSDFRHLPELAQVTGGSVTAYIARVNQLLRDSTLRATLGQQVREFATERFSVGRTATDLFNLSSHVLNEKERQASGQAAPVTSGPVPPRQRKVA